MKKFIKPFFLSMFVIVFVGPIIGTFFFSLFVQHNPLFVISRDIAGVPWISYSYITILPFALPVGFICCIFCYIYATRYGFHYGLRVWYKHFAIIGLIFGLICVSYFIILSLSDGSISLTFRWGLLGSLTGLSCSLIVCKSWYSAQISR